MNMLTVKYFSLLWQKEKALYSLMSTSTPVLPVRYGLFREVNCFRSGCVARQERNHSEKVSERERRAHFAVAVLFGPQFSAALSQPAVTVVR